MGLCYLVVREGLFKEKAFKQRLTQEESQKRAASTNALKTRELGKSEEQEKATAPRLNN